MTSMLFFFSCDSKNRYYMQHCINIMMYDVQCDSNISRNSGCTLYKLHEMDKVAHLSMVYFDVVD